MSSASFGVAVLALLVSMFNAAWQVREARRRRQAMVTVVASFRELDDYAGVFAFVSVFSTAHVTIVGCGQVKRGRFGRPRLEEGWLAPPDDAPVRSVSLPESVEPGAVRTFVVGTDLPRENFTALPLDDSRWLDYQWRESLWPRLALEGSTVPFHADMWIRTSSGHVYRSVAEEP